MGSLAQLGGAITRAISTLGSQPIDEKVLDGCLKEICTALLQADVNVKMVQGLRQGIKKRVNIEELAAGLNKQRVIEKAVFDELVSLLDSGEKVPELKKGKLSVVMTVGLQGCGKTTTCTKYAYHFRKKGWKPALVCADTFRAGAFDQLKQNATKAQIPFYGSYKETDPAVIAQQGVQMFKDEGRDLIIVDTSGRHKQEAALFEEMRQVAAAVKPDVVIFVMDGSIGQAAFDQARAFRESVEVGAVIVTKMDGHAKGGGALSAVSATKSPIIFLGTGEHMDQFESFEPRRFVQRLLGKGDVTGLMDKIQDVIPEDRQPELIETITKGNISMRVLRDMFESVLEMGPMSQMMGMLPGMNMDMLPGMQAGDKNSQLAMKRYITITESMTDKELDSTSIKMLSEPSRVMRLARGSGRPPAEVHMLLEAYKNYAKYASQALKAANIPKNMKNMKGGMDMNPRQMQQTMANMTRALPPNLLKQMGGAGGLQSLMKQMESGGMGGLAGLGGAMGGGPGRKK
uniref:Signal recognition particle 54 kDa protein n=1 Tax=Chlamydomonas euryale TaxID=1486919 RepID=A0A7R9YRS2_9CHLO|mmetsp:Transcript_16271/g.48475  ORF Transcript_16271/g.48475 Transcript_16271/m.48475 type:complete len:515 (+) Transcript_16271:219-1763(+)